MQALGRRSVVDGLHRHRVDGDVPLPAGFEGYLIEPPISASGLPKPMTGTVIPTFNFLLAVYSLVTTVWLPPPLKARPTPPFPF
jgi:hypothetical protein